MPRKILQILETAYRCNSEEQDDPIIWIAHAMKGAGATLDVLLRGNSVSYGVRGQDASGLRFGEKRQTQPPRIDDDLARLMGKGVEVYIVEEDAAERGIEPGDLLGGVKTLSRAGIIKLFGGYEQIWYW